MVDLATGIATGEGVDTLADVEDATGSQSADNISGSSVENSLKGEDGGDTIIGREDKDEIGGNGGNDTLNGDGGRDKVHGDDGDDEIDGGPEDDKVYDDEPDTYGGLVGGRGADTVRGGDGDDKLNLGPPDENYEDRGEGGAGDDTIDSANHPASKDRVSCGDGQDKVVADKEDVVEDDCEDVKYIEDEVPKALSGGNKIDRGIAAFERHMSVGASGELNLDKQGLNQEDIDPAIRDYLQTQLDNTNGMIRDGRIKASDVFPRSNVKKSPYTNMPTGQSDPDVGGSSSPSSGRVSTMQTEGGETGVGVGWYGPEYYLTDLCGSI